MNEVRLTPPVISTVPGNASAAGAGDKQSQAVKAAQSQSAISAAKAAVHRQAEIAAADKAVSQAVADLNAYLQNEQRDLRFNIDDGSGKMVVSVVDRESGELIRQIPNEVTLQLAARAREEEPLQLINLRG